MKPDAPRLKIVRTFNAPRTLVFACWTDSAHMARWFMLTDMTVPHTETDIRVGGGFRTCLRAADGTEHWVRGEYREITPDSRLVFTHGWEDATGAVPHWTECALDFEDLGAKTRLTFRQSPFASSESRDGHADGWSSTFDGLDRYLKSLAKPD
jgi:uncharacterized protein YndB with AHSA1/START domain